MVISGFPREAYGESRIWAIFVPIIPRLDTHPSNRKRHYLDQRYADLFALLLKALTMTLYYAVLLIFSGSNFSPFFETAFCRLYGCPFFIPKSDVVRVTTANPR